MGPNRNDRGQDGSARTLSTLKRATKVVEFLMESGGATVAEISEALSLSKSSAYNYVSTMHDDGWLVKKSSTYHLSPKFFQVGAYVRMTNTLFETARSEVDDLAEDTGETTHISTEHNNREIHLYKAHGDKAVGDEYHRAKLHTSSYLHDTATGKAILSAMPKADVEAIIDANGLPEKTPNTITDRDELFDQLETIRDRGYAVNDEEEIEGLRAVGAPIQKQRGEVAGSISLSGPTSRLRDERFREEIPKLVIQTANVIEVNLHMEYRLSEDQP